MMGFLIDMDGVLYRGGELIPGADAFIQRLLRDEVPFMFLTNNSQRTRRDVALKVQRLGIDVGEEHVFTCAMATARYLASQKPRGTAYVIGEGGLLTALHQNGYTVVDKEADFVVIGECRNVTFEMLEAATNMVLGGARLIATNLDPSCPTSTGTRPGCGAIVALLEAAAKTKAFSVGKPSPIIMRAARKELGLATDETVMIGDTMETDILGGLQMGYRTVLVLSGGTRLQDLKSFAFEPDHVISSVADLVDAPSLEEAVGRSGGRLQPQTRHVGRYANRRNERALDHSAA